jgi:hypothetical protein
MTKDEALDLALEALESVLANHNGAPVLPWIEARDAIKQVCSAPVQDSTCSEALRAQGKAYPRTCRKCGKGPCIALVNAALDKKAENARELGLDYEPVECPVCKATDSPYPNCGCVRYVDSPAPVQEPVAVDQATMDLAESVGLIGPASRTHDLHAAIQRFHDLICVNATIKAAKMAADAIRESTPPAAQRKHVTNGNPCWCEPETSYTDPETGASVIVHKEPQ